MMYDSEDNTSNLYSENMLQGSGFAGPSGQMLPRLDGKDRIGGTSLKMECEENAHQTFFNCLMDGMDFDDALTQQFRHLEFFTSRITEGSGRYKLTDPDLRATTLSYLAYCKEDIQEMLDRPMDFSRFFAGDTRDLSTECMDENAISDEPIGDDTIVPTFEAETDGVWQEEQYSSKKGCPFRQQTKTFDTEADALNYIEDIQAACANRRFEQEYLSGPSFNEETQRYEVEILYSYTNWDHFMTQKRSRDLAFEKGKAYLSSLNNEAKVIYELRTYWEGHKMTAQKFIAENMPKLRTLTGESRTRLHHNIVAGNKFIRTCNENLSILNKKMYRFVGTLMNLRAHNASRIADYLGRVVEFNVNGQKVQGTRHAPGFTSRQYAEINNRIIQTLLYALDGTMIEILMDQEEAKEKTLLLQQRPYCKNMKFMWLETLSDTESVSKFQDGDITEVAARTGEFSMDEGTTIGDFLNTRDEEIEEDEFIDEHNSSMSHRLDLIAEAHAQTVGEFRALTLLYELDSLPENTHIQCNQLLDAMKETDRAMNAAMFNARKSALTLSCIA